MNRALAAGSSFAPGQLVRHPERPDWGVGQVQSAIGSRVTVNFEHAGKVTVNVDVIQLEELSEHDLDPEHDLDRASAGPRSPLTR